MKYSWTGDPALPSAPATPEEAAAALRAAYPGREVTVQGRYVKQLLGPSRYQTLMGLDVEDLEPTDAELVGHYQEFSNALAGLMPDSCADGTQESIVEDWVRRLARFAELAGPVVMETGSMVAVPDEVITQAEIGEMIRLAEELGVDAK